MHSSHRIARLTAALVLGLAVASSGGRAAATDTTIDSVVEQNRRLEEQVKAQQRTIDDLSAKMAELTRGAEQQNRELKALRERVDAPAGKSATPPAADREHEIRISGETGIAFFNTGPEGPFPKAEMRVDDPVLSFEAPVWKDTYFFGELKLLTRETSTDSFQLGELYVDFENVSGLWGKPDLLNFRAGRINTPFGEEYQVRGPVENPLISHSLSDVWGCDEGAEIYGAFGPVRYVVAVQNGGLSRLHDYNADKAVVARLGWDPIGWLHLSGSVMRTGELSPSGDGLSDIWLANGFIRSIGGATTTAFWGDLYEGDAVARWKGGSLRAAVGGIRYADNDRAANNARRLRYGYLEMVQNIAGRLYGAARYSQIRAPGGYPLAGGGNASQYFYRGALTDRLGRVSLGLGYRIGPPLVLKLEYSWNSGHLVKGYIRDDENFLGSEIGLKF